MNSLLKICALADIHGSYKKLHLMGSVMRESDLILVAGDITRNGTRAEAIEFFSIIEEYNQNIFAVHGNWDRVEVQDYLDEKKYGLHGRSTILDTIGFIGVGGSNPTPVRTPSEYNDEELFEIAAQGYRLVENAQLKVLLSHTPPKGIQDTTYLRLHGGSPSIRDFIFEKKIDLCICGHIHEAWGHKKVNDVLVVNCGSFRSRAYYMITIDGTTITCNKQKVS